MQLFHKARNVIASIAIITVQSVIAETALPPGAIASVSPVADHKNDSLLQFESALQSEAKAHREYLKETLDDLKWTVGVFVTLALAAFTWLNYKSGKEVREHVNARFKAGLDDLVNEKLGKFDIFLAENRSKIEQNVLETNRLVDRTADFTSAWTYAFLLLQEPSKTEDFELARRDAMRQLEALRADFPHWRHLGIMLARLNVYFGEYDSAIDILTTVISEREKRGLPHGIDYSALLYSRACYENRAAEQCSRRQENRAHRLRVAAWRDINLSVQADPENLAEALLDKDLETLWNRTTRRKNLLGKCEIPKQKGRNLLSTILCWLTS